MRKEVDTDVKIKVSNYLPFARLCMMCSFKKGQNRSSAVTQQVKTMELCFCYIFRFLSWEVWDGTVE